MPRDEAYRAALERGTTLCGHPEGTRSPDRRSLHRLRRHGRIAVDLRISPPLEDGDGCTR